MRGRERERDRDSNMGERKGKRVRGESERDVKREGERWREIYYEGEGEK